MERVGAVWNPSELMEPYGIDGTLRSPMEPCVGIPTEPNEPSHCCYPSESFIFYNPTARTVALLMASRQIRVARRQILAAANGKGTLWST